MKKKLTAFLLSLLMSVQMLPLFALAEEAETPAESIIPLELPEHIAPQEETAPAQADLSESDNQYAAYSFNETTQKLTKTLCDIPAATTITGTTTVWETGWYIADGTVELSSARVGGDVKLVLKDGCKLTVGGITVTESDRLTIYAQKNGTGELISAASANNYAGIGGGSKEDGGIITIHGGKITATGGEMAAGIGGGFQGACGTVTIYGGEVTAAGGFNGAGIGTGSAPRNSGGSIAVYGGTVTVSTTDNSAMGDQRPRAIGGGFGGSVDTITINSKMKVKDGSGNAVTLNNTWAETLTGCSYTIYALPVVEYRYYDEAQRIFLTDECDDYAVVTPDTTAWTGGWYVVYEDVTIDGDVSITGDVHLILTDGKTLTVGGTISGDSNFWVYAQSNGENMGSLNADKIIFQKSINISGGNVTASNTDSTVCIISHGELVINDGNVTVTTGLDSIGGVRISGGNVTVSNSMSGIHSSGSILIDGGVVNVTGRGGIFSGKFIDIHGGTVSVTTIRAEGDIRIGGDGCDVTAQGIPAVYSASFVGVFDSMAVYNQSNERVILTKGENWEDVLTGSYYRFIDEDLVIPYRYYDEASGAFKDGECLDYELIDKDTIEWEIPENDDEKWYVVKGEAEISGRPTVSGKVHLILTDDCVLTVEDGINVYIRNSLSIYGQENGTGKLCAGNDGHNVPYAGIGGGFDAGKVEIHGGEVSAKSEFGAGIGGGYDGGCGGTVNIHGGVVTATSIHGAGIGGGYGDKIGGNGGSVTITGGVVTATSTHCAGIGGGYGERDRGQAATVTLGDNMAVSEGALVNTCYSVKIVEKVPYRYYDEASGAFKDGECLYYEVIDQDRVASYLWGSSERDKWYVVKGNVTITGVQRVVGNVHLILTDDCVLTVKDGIEVSDCLSIYAQEGNTGVLHAGNQTFENDEAGIGLAADTSTVNIHGGVVIAESYDGAGIGGRSVGLSGDMGGMVNIHGGVVTAASYRGAGIGGGYGENFGGAGGTVRITGGSVTANSRNGAGIGGGYSEKDSGGAATVTLGDNMVVIDGGLGNSYQSVEIVEKELPAQTMLPKTSIRVTGTPGLRFAAYVTDAQRKACSSYGFLVARENATLRSDPTKLVFNATNSATGTNDHGVTYTSGEAYNKANGIDKIYAEDGEAFGLPDVEATFFTGVMQGIPQAFYAENLIARPYIVIDGITIYGETYAKSLYTNACAIRDGGYQGLDEDGIKYINGIISAVDKEADIDVGGLTE